MLLILLGAWGALIAFIGPYFHYAFTPDHTWTYTTGRLWLEILPGAAAFLGGLIVLVAATRPTAVFGAWVAALGGIWFIVGRPLSTLWTVNHVAASGQPVGGYITRAVVDIGFFSGLGAAILLFAAFALGRFTVVGVREAAHARAAAEEEPVTEPAPAGTAPAGTALAADRAESAGPAASSPRRSLSGRLPRLPKRQADQTAAADRPAGMTADPATRESMAGNRSASGGDAAS